METKNLNMLLDEASEFINFKMKAMSTSDRVSASRCGKSIVLRINEIYKKNKDPKLMEVMKNVTFKKRKIDKRLKVNHLLTI